ncbi:Gfo/Idh/MocA family oxidoreductase [Enterococcus hulanensis]|uniref:Gfo/Idh/MocA family oxidoreductase n=1 Tax=Enterococcus hulanensis TaxID=2559929 RepID=A0ABU3F0B7_9ENTE|nr:Gfo/Idh/MocA family oxidoreductase [Enterococcus hulanensis]MDT2600569.1 Gfo/Idh/MocA family oxidoreductase [Enterococcus hulanensis]MDT2609693.1 Gfo/Idh/MocA family oxidoreductase [Enterococcus hulanensis]MDT2617679.1 Gfo/Idh/MocA family oxidoreductase [Enterococcus hulanensis]MDT2628904.1 Gfo/Idh/MocA family oxidoreductase [Enterococcus hulanensis]MDT2656244.1 Gfo/Idh/MocA family oxidoreductase [Enterococcus hulanensis]
MIKTIEELEFVPEMPEKPRPIASIGAGGIVSDCHYPAYKLAGFPVLAVYDLDYEKASQLAEAYDVPTVCRSLTELIEIGEKEQAIFDLAVPASEIIKVLQKLPEGAAVLIQKPMGESIEQAKKIVEICEEKKFVAGINFQLRQAPYIIAAKQMVDSGQLGEICDFEIRETVYTPWNLWDFLFKVERMEINYHSIHFVDVVRYFLGSPSGVYCKTMKHPKAKELAQVKSNIIFDYGEYQRAGILSNHNHEFGLDEQECFLKIEGTKGAIKITMGVYLDYPTGLPDKFVYNLLEDGLGWRELELSGSWFPESFIGTMGGLMKKLDDPAYNYVNDVKDAYETMCVVEACYQSNESGVTPVAY